MYKGSLLEQKKLGAYYTPIEVTKILCEWAIRNPHDLILEPSFGACGFLESSRSKLIDLNNQSPMTQLFGCDIDSRAFSNYLNVLFADSTLSERFIKKDFLALTLDDFSVKGFDVVIGNPPYVSYHNMSESQRVSVFQTARSQQLSIDKRASLWVYFVLHSFKFLKKGGRIAWILPGSFLHTRYSDEVKRIIARNFGESMVIQLGQRIFSSAGTEENTAILLADDWNCDTTKKDLKVYYAPNVTDLQNFVSSWQEGAAEGVSFVSRVNYSLLKADASTALEHIEKNVVTASVGDFAEVLIGIVTGANRFFVINRKTAQQWNLNKDELTPIFSRFRFANGISLELDELEEAEKQNFRCLFVDSLKTPDSLASKVYFWSFPEEEKSKNATFQKRPVWHQPHNSRRIPSAFFAYMHHEGPRLILNEAQVNSTNTIHRIFFKERVCIKGRISNLQLSIKERQLAAISIMSSYSQLSAEIEGRVYGSGVLKHEPTEVKKIKLLWAANKSATQVRRTFNKIDKLLKQGNSDEARKTADKFLLDAEKYQHELKIIARTLEELRHKRYGKKQPKL